ncbi:MAG TPA: hypothetical protein VMV61_11650 [Patescibacteria group bacterium]|nr:hypothetical protein [Patescibacteria group bacterium]
MPRYLTFHTLACLTRQGAAQLVERFRQAPDVRTVRAQVNLQEGKMLIEWEAADREPLEAWLNSEKMHRDWLMRVELEAREGPLEPAV